MLSFRRFGKSQGRLGNQCWEYAFLIMMREKYGIQFRIPHWNYGKFFNAKYEEITDENDELQVIKEPKFEYSPEFVDDLLSQSKEKSIDMLGYVQSYKYWWDIKDKILDAFTFSEDLMDTIELELKHLQYKIDGSLNNNVAIHIRRGDYVGNPNYINIRSGYYVTAIEYIKSKIPDAKFFIFSDDYAYCRWIFQAMPELNFCFEWLTEQEHLTIMAHCQHHILSNSTFPWWGAFLSQRYVGEKNQIIIRPNKIFDGKLAVKSSEADIYPEQWICWDVDSRIDMSDATFIIPTSLDSGDRYDNFRLAVKYINKYFKTNILVGEQGSQYAFQKTAKNNGCKYIYFDKIIDFHRTKMLNELTKIAETEIVFNYDADILFPPIQLYAAYKKLKEGADFVYPYNQAFVRLNRDKWYRNLREGLDLGILDMKYDAGNPPIYPVSLGGCVAYKKKSFIEAGMENEHFISFGPEDVDRYYRFRTLGYDIRRINGPLFHVEHFISENSASGHKDFENNQAEWAKVRFMTKRELKEYINTWEWLKT